MVKKRKRKPERIPEAVQVAILEYLTAKGNASADNISKDLGVGNRLVTIRILRRMQKTKAVKYDAGKAGTWRITGPPRIARKI